MHYIDSYRIDFNKEFPGTKFVGDMVLSGWNKWRQMTLDDKSSYVEMAEKITTRYCESYA